MFCFRRGPFNLPRVGRKRARPNVCHINQSVGHCLCVSVCCLYMVICIYVFVSVCESLSTVGGHSRVGRERECRKISEMAIVFIANRKASFYYYYYILYNIQLNTFNDTNNYMMCLEIYGKIFTAFLAFFYNLLSEFLNLTLFLQPH